MSFRLEGGEEIALGGRRVEIVVKPKPGEGEIERINIPSTMEVGKEYDAFVYVRNVGGTNLAHCSVEVSGDVDKFEWRSPYLIDLMSIGPGGRKVAHYKFKPKSAGRAVLTFTFRYLPVLDHRVGRAGMKRRSVAVTIIKPAPLVKIASVRAEPSTLYVGDEFSLKITLRNEGASTDRAFVRVIPGPGAKEGIPLNLYEVTGINVPEKGSREVTLMGRAMKPGTYTLVVEAGVR